MNDSNNCPMQRGRHRVAAAVTPATEQDSIALVSAATEEKLGPWLARNWGILADTPFEVLEQIDL